MPIAWISPRARRAACAALLAAGGCLALPPAPAHRDDAPPVPGIARTEEAGARRAGAWSLGPWSAGARRLGAWRMGAAQAAERSMNWRPVQRVDAARLSGLAQDGRTRFHAACMRDMVGYAFRLQGYDGDALPRRPGQPFELQVEVELTAGARRFLLPFAYDDRPAGDLADASWTSPRLDAARLLDALASGRRMRVIGPDGVAAIFTLDGTAYGVATIRKSCGY